jgi:hypothetical protein
MSTLEKVVFLSVVGIVIFFWSKYIVGLMIGIVVKNNSKSNYLVKKRGYIIKGFQIFCWLFYALFIISILSSN